MSLSDFKAALIFTYKKKSSYIITGVGIVLMVFLFTFFTSYESIKGNLGETYLFFEIVLQVLISLLFGINAALLVQKLLISAKGDAKATGASAIGSIFALLVTGCPACGITIASFFGLAAIFSTLPLFGMELKIIGFLLLGYATLHLGQNLFVCKSKPSK